MKFEETGNINYPHKLTFQGEEITIIRAVFKEYIYNLARKGNTGSISDYDVWVAGWIYGKDQAMLVRSYESVVEKLETFSSATDEAIGEIPQITGVSPFANRDIPKRYKLGKAALDLAITIRQRAAAEVFVEGLSDSEISEFLEGSQPDD